MVKRRKLFPEASKFFWSRKELLMIRIDNIRVIISRIE